MAINWMMVHFSTFFDAVNAGIGSFIIGFQHVLFGIPFYMYYKLPVITGDLPPCGYFMRKDEYGFLVKCDSVEEYTDKILYLLNNPAVLASYGEKGHELVIKKYNWEKEEYKLKNVYNKLLEK